MTIIETLKLASKRVREVLDRDRSDTWNQALLPLLSSVDRGCLLDASIRLTDAIMMIEQKMREAEDEDDIPYLSPIVLTVQRPQLYRDKFSPKNRAR